MKIEPIGERVLVEVLEEASQTPAGIILPETAKEKPQRGVVLAVGESESEDEEPQIKVGDKIIFAKYSGTEIEIDGKEYLILEMSDILARIKEDE